jgi:hypothetical protein
MLELSRKQYTFLLPGDMTMEKNVWPVQLGGVTVRLRNYANVAKDLLESVFAKSRLGSQELLLILDMMDDFGCKDRGSRGKTIPSMLLDPRKLWKRGYDPKKGVTHFRELDSYKWADKSVDICQIDQ